MYRFLALIWDPTEPNAEGLAAQILGAAGRMLPDYRPALVAPGFRVLHAPSPDCAMRVYPLPEECGVVLGQVFPMNMDDWCLGWSWHPSASQATEIISTQGAWLTRRLWGGYIAFLRDPAGANTFVLRDCSGKIPCYRLRLSGIDLLFPDTAALCALGLVPTSMNMDYICAFLCSSQLQVRDTALAGVTELLAGDCFRRRSADDFGYHCAWNPVELLAYPRIDSFDKAVREVRSVTLRCVGAWASMYDSILHQLSGGLDSAVVLACLTQAARAPAIVCMNRFGETAPEDERAFARLAASKAGAMLLEFPFFRDAHVIDETSARSPPTAKPAISAVFGAFDIPLRNDLAVKFGARSIWTGQGGDHMFLQIALPIAPLDYASLRGFSPGLLRSLQDAARLSRQSYWRVARQLWKRDSDVIAAGLGSLPIDKQPFVTPAARARVSRERIMHPWTLLSESLPPGQRLQIALLSEILNRHRPLPQPQVAYECHPLLSQPLLELCLRIPSYVHLRGIDRAVERAAFAELIPAEILARRQKGQSTFSALEIIHRSNGYLREALLEGILANEGIIDRSALEPYLNEQRPLEVPSIFPLLSCIAAELWVRSWLIAAHPPASPGRVPSVTLPKALTAQDSSDSAFHRSSSMRPSAHTPGSSQDSGPFLRGASS
jgi:asparagine synthase (glutamine-hydrolysing)